MTTQELKSVPTGTWWTFSTLCNHEGPDAVIRIYAKPGNPMYAVAALVYTTETWRAFDAEFVRGFVNPRLVEMFSNISAAEFWEIVKTGRLQLVGSKD